MKKFYLIAATLLAAGSMSAQNFTGLQGRVATPHQTNITEYTGESTPKTRTAPKGAIPSNIIGNKYVLTYGSFTNYVNCASNFTVEKGEGDTVILKDILKTYNLKGIYNKAVGTVEVPTGQVVGTFSTYGDVTSYTLLAPGYTQYSKVDPCVMTFTDDNVTFDNGFYATSTAGGHAFMKNIVSYKANGTMKFNQYNSSGALVKAYEYPVYFSSVNDNQMVVKGFAAWLYAHDYNVQFDITGTTATVPGTCPVDYYTSTTAGEQVFYLLKHASNGVSLNPTFNVTKSEDGKITLTATSNLFWGYEKTTDSWNGFFIRDMVITYDKNLGSSGVQTVDNDENAPAVYYNMNGCKVNAETLAPGLYIKVQGSKATKIMVK